VSISNITMRDIGNSPIFMRLGARLRGPEGTKPGELRRIKISNVVVHNASPRLGCVISGIPGHEIEDVSISNVRIYYAGGGTEQMAATRPPEKDNAYPEPAMFGDMPSYGFFIRHAKNIQLDNVEVSVEKDDARPAFVLDDVRGAEFNHIKAERPACAPIFLLRGVEKFTTHRVSGVADMEKDKLPDEQRF
jgi:hypothetical protein